MTKATFDRIDTGAAIGVMLRLLEDYTDQRRDITLSAGAVVVVDRKTSQGSFLIIMPHCSHCKLTAKLTIPHEVVEVVTYHAPAAATSGLRYAPAPLPNAVTIEDKMRKRGVTIPRGSIMLGRGDNLKVIVAFFKKLEGQYCYCKLEAGKEVNTPYVSFIAQVVEIETIKKINTKILCPDGIIQLPLGSIIDLRPAFRHPEHHFHSRDATFLFDGRQTA